MRPLPVFCALVMGSCLAAAEPAAAGDLYLTGQLALSGGFGESGGSVDLGPGGYRTFTPDTRPLACSDMHEGDRVELAGRGWYREGRILQIRAHDTDTDVIFPCMVITDILAGNGDSGGAEAPRR